MDDIEVSVVLPCLNEQEAIASCVKKIREVFARDGLKGEVIVIDNGSDDRSREIAANEGAKVILEPRRGYGSAYLRGLKEARGRYIIMGDSDNSYDFYDIPRFLVKLREGYDFVIGSRFKGKIYKSAMPLMNRYIGNPVLSGMTRLFFHVGLSDIHCGMRALTREAFSKMKLISLGMEFATEMVVAALQNGLKTCEIPIDYYPRKGESKLKPFSDAWRHVRFMLLYCPDWLYFIPGMIGFLTGISVLLLLLKGPFLFLGRYWDLHVMVFASMLCILSYQVLSLGVYARIFAMQHGFLKTERASRFFQRYFNLEKGLIFGGLIFMIGFVITLLIFIEWFSRHFGTLYRIRESIFAMTLLVVGLQTAFSSFFISLLFIEKKEGER